MNTAILLASGSGRRFGGETPKQFLPLAGKPLALYSIETFAAHPAVDHLVVACHPDWIETLRGWLRAVTKPFTLLPGGAERADSVWAGLRAAPPATRIALIHDTARPFVSAALISALIETAARHGAALPALPCADSMLEVEGGAILRYLDRPRLRRAQTPQVFQYSLIVKAFEEARAQGLPPPTDDAQLVHRLGAPVICVPGEEQNCKITTPEDFALAEARLKAARRE